MHTLTSVLLFLAWYLIQSALCIHKSCIYSTNQPDLKYFIKHPIKPMMVASVCNMNTVLYYSSNTVYIHLHIIYILFCIITRDDLKCSGWYADITSKCHTIFVRDFNRRSFWYPQRILESFPMRYQLNIFISLYIYRKHSTNTGHFDCYIAVH